MGTHYGIKRGRFWEHQSSISCFSHIMLSNFNSSWLWLVQSHAACLLFVSALVDLSFSPVYIYPLETSHEVFRETHFIVDKLLITAYLLFPNSQGKQPPNSCLAVSVVREQQTHVFPFLLCFKCNWHRIWKGFRVPDVLFFSEK